MRRGIYAQVNKGQAAAPRNRNVIGCCRIEGLLEEGGPAVVLCGEELTTIGENPKAKSCRIASFARLSNRGESRETPGPISTFHSATRSQIKNYLEKSSASSSSSISHHQIYISTKCIYFLFMPFRRATTAHTPALNLNRTGDPTGI